MDRVFSSSKVFRACHQQALVFLLRLLVRCNSKSKISNARIYHIFTKDPKSTTKTTHFLRTNPTNQGTLFVTVQNDLLFFNFMLVWSYVSDVEGNFHYWESFIRLSEALIRGIDGQLVLKDGYGFIFGGDSVDKGSGDIRVVRDLLQLKRTYPSRVFLLIGNRDLNKLRFGSELEDRESLTNPKFDRAAWFPPERRRTYDQFLKDYDISDSIESRAKWMLSETMGAETTFQFRKAELHQLGLPCDDESVAHSFLHSVLPHSDENFMLQYLKQAQTMVRIGSTLFVHGGINNTNLGTVPGDDVRRTTVNEWMKDLNGWVEQQLQEYEANNSWARKPTEEDRDKGRTGVRGAEKLIEYGTPGGNNHKTVIYAYHFPNGNGEELSEQTSKYLSQSGVHRIIVGHQPHGDCPSVLATDPMVQVVTGDTSYSDINQADNRGCAVSEILLFEESQIVTVHGVLKDERLLSYSLPCPTFPSDTTTDPYIGKKLKGNFWVKSKLLSPPPDGREYMICKGSGYSLTIEWLSTSEIQQNII